MRPVPRLLSCTILLCCTGDVAKQVGHPAVPLIAAALRDGKTGRSFPERGLFEVKYDALGLRPTL